MVRIHEACKSLGVSPSTLRNLERRTSLRITRDQAGHRRYSEEDILTIEGILFGPAHSSKELTNEKI